MPDVPKVFHEKGFAHGPFVASCDDDFEPEMLRSPLPETKPFQYGYCGVCYAPMRWDPEIQQLVMWKE
jgi:hypothetical protein